MKKVAQVISQIRTDLIVQLMDGQTISLDVEGETFSFDPNDILIQRHEKEGLLVLTENNLTVALDTELTEALIEEGFAREFINKVQNMRKDMNLEVMDNIQIDYQTTAKLQKAIHQFDPFIKTETLALKIESKSVDKPIQWDVNGENCEIEIKKLSN
ncbi:MAG: hypothetical protein HQM14_17545 [SAR324 cluster bacterium]|nr:hypothetical protein [SAR324 cluster bacterium]